MNAKLIKYLTVNQEEFTQRWSQILGQEWHLRIAANSLSGNKGGTRMTSLRDEGTSKTDEMFSILVKRYYSDLLLTLHHGNSTGIPIDDFPHYTPYGIRMTLGSFLELLIAGEKAFSEKFLDEVNAEFSGIKGIDAYDEVIGALRSVFTRYSQKFCNECASPLVKAIREMARKGQEEISKLQPSQSYDRYPYSN